MKINNVFGERVHSLRAKKHLTQERLADLSGLSQAEISRIETGRFQHLSRETIANLAQAFEISPEALVRGTSFSSEFGQLEAVALSPYESNPFTAYFASALTGLADEQLSEIIALDQKVDSICSEYQPYRLLLYRPRLRTSPKDSPDIPARKVYEIDQERVSTSDLVIAAAVFPSLGAGMEIQLALQSCASVILLVKEGQAISRMVTGCPARMVVVKYQNLEDLGSKLVESISQLLPAIADFRFQRGAAQNASTDFELGQRIYEVRERRGIETAALARMVGVGTAYVENLESAPEQITNPSLSILRRISRALGVSETFLITGHEPPVQYTVPIFDDHLQALRIVAVKNSMPLTHFEDLWKQHLDKFQYDLSILGASNRADIGTVSYWSEQYEKFQKEQSSPQRLF